MNVQANLILVTGATGCVGSALVRRLAMARGQGVSASVRGGGAAPAGLVPTVFVGDLSADTDWSPVLMGVSEVVHAAACVHVMKDAAAEPLAEFRRVNVNGHLRWLVKRLQQVSGALRSSASSRSMGKQLCRASPLSQMMSLRRKTLLAFPRWKPSRACGRLRPKPAWRWR